MSRNFLFVLLSLTVPGLLWGAQGDSPDGASVDNNEGPSKMVEIKGGSPVAPGIIRMPYVLLRTTSRVPRMLWRMFTWLPRHVASSVAQSLSRLMVAVKVYVTDGLGYLASSERTDMARVRRGVPAPANATGSKPTSRRFHLTSMLVSLFTYPLKVAWRTGYNLVRFSPLAGTMNLYDNSLLSKDSGLMNKPLMQKVSNATRAVVDFAVAEVWNFTKANVLPRLDSFVNDLKDSGTAPESLLAVLIELQTLYHIFKFLGMA